jgi:hypothetical protein
MAQVKRRSPVLAALASLSMPGLGQLYNGQPTLAILWFVAYWTVGAFYTMRIFEVLLAPNPAAEISRPLALLALMALIWLGGVVQAVFGALGQQDYVLQAYNRGAVYLGAYIVAYVIFPLVLAFPVARWALARHGITTPEARAEWLGRLRQFAAGRGGAPGAGPAARRVDLKIGIPDPDSLAAKATTVLHVTLVGGLDGGIYDATTDDALCTHRISTSAPSWAGLYANPADTAGITAIQFRIPIDQGETNDFQLSVNRGTGTESRSYVVDGRRSWGENGKGRASVSRRDGTAVIRIEAATAEGVRVEAVVQCREVVEE